MFHVISERMFVSKGFLFPFLIFSGLIIIVYTMSLFYWADHTFSMLPDPPDMPYMGALFGLAVWMVGIGSYFFIARKRSPLSWSQNHPET